jgi:aminopeptidase-like protein
LSVKKCKDYAEITIFCNRCNKNITLKIDYKHRDKADRFPFEYLYVHGESNDKHGITLYIDKDMQVRGTELMRTIETDSNPEEESKIFPKQKGKVSPMARSLGMISKNEFEILDLCDGKTSVFTIAQKKNLKLGDINKIIQKLQDKSYIELVKRL